MVTEIAYDRSLVCLAARWGIDVTPTNFVHPRIERERLELELERRGVDLGAPPSQTDGSEGRLAPVLELGGVDGGFGAVVDLELARGVPLPDS